MLSSEKERKNASVTEKERYGAQLSVGVERGSLMLSREREREWFAFFSNKCYRRKK